jgi:hypothetical protein
MMNGRILGHAGCIAAFILAANPQPTSAIGGQFGLEFAIDAPWRLEPTPVGTDRFSYSAIPITIVFHDTLFEGGRGVLGALHFEKISVGKLVGIRVTEMGTNQPPVTDIPVTALEEIEVKRGLSTRSGEPLHQVCRPSLGQNCTSLLTISDSHEWHGAFWYVPKTAATPGRNVYLKVTVRTLAKTKVRVPPPIPNAPPVFIEVEIPKEWTNYLVVHAGEAPLPRFGPEWLYGDVHYHSQMTDNEGESAYSYRNVARALGATGFDFVFATDHASDGEQVDGKVGGSAEARDLNQPRFGAAKGILYGPDGVNQLIASEAARIGFARVKSAGILPQVYMGEELDAWPEMSAKEYADGKVYYGDLGLFGGGLKYDWLSKQRGFVSCVGTSSFGACKAKYAVPASPAKQTYLLFDDQGVPFSQEIDNYIAPLGSVLNYGNWIPGSVKPHPSRQHIVYFPLDAGLSIKGWISSETGDFGGASKRLQQLVGEIEANGFAFLAHPVEDAEPGSISGPDVVPYSDVALTRAWSSPAILGLQFWNENDRYRSEPKELDPTVVAETKTVSEGIVTSVSYTYRWPFPGTFPEGSPWHWQQAGQLDRAVMASTFNKLHHGAAAWDRYLRKGVDPQQTASLTWLTKGEPRKWFMAGGSDSHGDWNYRRYGRPNISNRWSDYPVGDTAIGNPRNLVSMKVAQSPQTAGAAVDAAIPANGPRRYANREVIDAFRAGRFSVTDGPAIRIAVDKNRNGEIDDGDFQMGSTVHFFPGEHIPLLVEWYSTPEFGPIDQIDIYVGNQAATFAPKGHGSRVLPFFVNQAANLTEDYGGYKHDPSGVLQVKLANPAGQFNRINLPEGMRYHGVARIFLAPAQFQLASKDQALSYVRAFARTITDAQAQATGLCPAVGSAGSKCGDRFAFANPIWMKYRVACPQTTGRHPTKAPETVLTSRVTPYLDADNDGLPDVCERDIPNPCAQRSQPELGVDVDRPVIDGTRPPPPARGHAETGALARPPLATEEALNAPRPAKPVPGTSCQVLEARV